MSKIKVSSLGLGTWVMGGNNWGNVEEDNCAAVISAAPDFGINLIDAAPFYGFGRAEKAVGKAVKGKRDKYFIATKCGLTLCGGKEQKNLSGANIISEVEYSLRRLGVDYIDLYLTHWPDDKTPLEETYGVMARLKEQGKIKHIGACNVDAELIKKINKITPVSAVENEYSFLKRGSEDAFDYCRENGIIFIAYGALAGGVLTGKYDKEPDFPKRDIRNSFYNFYKGGAFAAARAAAGKFKKIAKKYNVPASAAALAWVMAQGGFITPLFGARTVSQLEENARAQTLKLTHEDIAFLNGN